MPALSLLDRLAELTDPRARRGRQYPLVPMLALCLVATLGGCTSVAAIAQFGRLRRHRLGHALGFHHGKMPAANTITDLLAQLDPDHLDRVIGDGLADRHAGGWEHIALDGKVLRGSRDGDTPGLTPAGRVCFAGVGGGRPDDRRRHRERAQHGPPAARRVAPGRGRGDRRRHVHARRCVRENPGEARELRGVREGQPDAVAGRRGGRVRRRRGRRFFPRR